MNIQKPDSLHIVPAQNPLKTLQQKEQSAIQLLALVCIPPNTPLFILSISQLLFFGAYFV